LRRRGATKTDIANAVRGDYVSLLVLDRVIMPGERRYTMQQLAAQAGADPEVAREVWRAVGFPDLPDHLVVFTDADVRAMRSFVERLESPWMLEWNLERALSQARVLNAALARVAEVESDDVASSFRAAARAGLEDEELAEMVVERFDFDDLSRLIDHAHRLQLRAALWRKLADTDPSLSNTINVGVGFVDLVGYTALSEDLETDDLLALVERFSTITHDTVVAGGGRIVKTIGDEVMYITDTVGTAAAIALALTVASTGDEMLPKTRAGVAFGAVLSRDGDYYGPVVNLASRLTEMARPGTVLVSAEVANALGSDPRFAFRRLAGRRVRDIGRVDIYRLSQGKSVDSVSA
jgi:adenylate cyclase